jgi:Protein of unknown function (DUF3592)
MDAGAIAGAVIGIVVAVLTVVITIVAVLFSLVVTVLATVGPFVLIFYLIKKSNEKKEADRKLMATGDPARATVLALEETGMLINNQPLVNLKLQIVRHGQPPYEHTHQMVLSMLNLPQVQPGATIPVRVDPENPKRIALELGKSVQAEAYCPYCSSTFDATELKCPHCGAAA